MPRTLAILHPISVQGTDSQRQRLRHQQVVRALQHEREPTISISPCHPFTLSCFRRQQQAIQHRLAIRHRGDLEATDEQLRRSHLSCDIAWATKHCHA